jgi:signal transduction histidine kinase
VQRTNKTAYQTWLVGEALLVGLLSAGTALFAAYPELLPPKALPELRLVLDTAVMLTGTLVAILTASRFAVEGRWVDLLLSAGFSTLSASILLFSIVPALGGADPRGAAWVDVAGRLAGWALIAIAPTFRGRVRARELALGNTLALLGLPFTVAWIMSRSAATALPDITSATSDHRPSGLTTLLSLQALVTLCAAVGFGLRFRIRGEDLDRWLALGATLMLFALLNLTFAPLRGLADVSAADFLMVLAYAVLFAGVWRAILQLELGRAVADERARVAREIHDGLAQYLFALSTHASMLEAGADPKETVAHLKEAATAAQQEAKFAVLALSTAAGNAPFDAALRRYVGFLVADGELDVDLEIDKGMRLGPDEQIEVFRIVQEGLANVRRHAGARHAEVAIGRRAGGERVVVVRDDGAGFEGEPTGAGQGLKNMRHRANRIGGSFQILSSPGTGTQLEIVLRA